MSEIDAESAETENTEAQETVEATPEAQPEAPKQENKNSGYLKRINKLTAQKHALERLLNEATEKLNAQDASEQDQALAYAEIAQAKLEKRKVDNEIDEAKGETWLEKVDAARAEIPDFDNVVNGYKGPQLKPAVAQMIMESDFGASLTYELAKNPDLAERLNSLSDISAQKEILRLEMRMEGQRSAPKPKPAQQQQAPETPKPKGGNVAAKERFGPSWTLADEREYRKLNKVRW